jgi:hypothetical protein
MGGCGYNIPKCAVIIWKIKGGKLWVKYLYNIWEICRMNK